MDNETDIEPLANEITGVKQTIDNGEPTELGFDGVPTRVDFDAESTGVEIEADHGEVHDLAPQEQVYNGLVNKPLLQRQPLSLLLHEV